MAFCIECGAKLPEGARFCSACGKAVAEVAAPAAETAPAAEKFSGENIIEENVYAPVTEAVAESEPVAAEVVFEPEATAEPVQEQPVSESPEAPVAEASVYTPAVAVNPEYTANTAPSSTREEQQKCLDEIYARLKNERLCWKIFGFVWIGYAVLFTLLAFAEAYFIIYPFIMYAPLAVISFIMVGKVDRYMNTLYTDCGPVVERCSSVGMIVFGALFNTVAMIFIIINFINVKSNKQTLEDIKRNQDAYNQNRS